MIFLTNIIQQYLNKFVTSNQVQECNYQDNYYGDQVCTLIKK